MKVTQEKLPASQIGLEIEITPEKSKETYEQIIRDFARAANIPGFRKGKVPRQILLQRLGTVRIKAAAVEELIRNSITTALEQEKISAIGQPQLRSSFEELVERYEPGGPLTFSAAVDVEPAVNLKQYSGLQVKAEEIKYDPASVDQFLEENQKAMATLIPVEGRAAQLGDVAVVDFQGRLANTDEGEPQEIPGATATDFQVELQEGRFIEGFIDGIVGMNLGETKEVPAQFPEAYPQEDIAGKAAVFTVTLKELKEKELPELNDDFAQEVSEFETLAQLRASLESRFQAEAEQKTKSNKQQALIAELLKYLEVELPETLIDEEVDSILTQTAVRLSQQGIDIKQLFTKDNIPQLRERSRPDAIERLKRSQALQEIAKRESLQVEPEAVTARVKELTAEYSDRDVDPERLRQVVEEEILTDKILNWLEEHSTIELVPEGSLSTAEVNEPTAEPATEVEQVETATATEANEAAVSEPSNSASPAQSPESAAAELEVPKTEG